MFRIGPIRSIAVVEGGVMGGVVRNWRAELVEAYPDLFHPAADRPGAAEASPDCGEGWRDLLERACVRIRAAVQADGGSFKATQIKEKYGTLRFYWSGVLSQEADSKVEEVVDLAEARSACTCELCGAEGRLYGPRCLPTRCEADDGGRQPEPMPSGLQNLDSAERVACDR